VRGEDHEDRRAIGGILRDCAGACWHEAEVWNLEFIREWMDHEREKEAA
jgi:hypothetical protein